MSKIKIESVLKNKNDVHKFIGKGIKTNDIITYNDKNVLTKIILDKTITIERKGDYYIKLNFEKNKKLPGIYEVNEGKFDITTETKKLKQEKNSIQIEYNLIINNVIIDTFYFSLQYTIDR